MGSAAGKENGEDLWRGLDEGSTHSVGEDMNGAFGPVRACEENHEWFMITETMALPVMSLCLYVHILFPLIVLILNFKFQHAL